MILSRGKTLELESPLEPLRSPHVPAVSASERDLATIERGHIVSVLEQCDWKIKGPGNTAEQLGLNPSTLRSRMKKLEISRPCDASKAVSDLRRQAEFSMS